MTVHDRTLELAAAALDFELARDEQTTLDRHLGSCLQCRGVVAGFAADARRLATRPTHVLAGPRAEAIRASLERPRRGTSPALALVVAALLLLVAVAAAAVGAQIIRQLEDRRLAVEPAPSGIVAPAPSGPAPSAMPDSPSWLLTPLGELTGLDFQPTAVARSEPGWVAVGSRACTKTGEWTFDCTLLVAVSQDGRRWERVAGATPLIAGYGPPMSGPEAGMSDVAGGPDGYVAVGFGSGDLGPGNAGRGVAGTAWWSADGRTWAATRLDAGARPSTVLRVGDRWLIGGVVYRDTGPVGAIWTSTDGRSWTLIDDPATFDVGGYVDTMEDPASGGITSLAASGGTILAGGQVCAEGGRPCTAGAWVSDDGLAWERIALPGGGWTLATGATADGFAAAVSECAQAGDPCPTALLYSADGRSWQRVPGTLPEGAAAASSDGTIVVVAGGFGSLAVQASADGAAWTDLGPVPVSEQVSWGSPVLGDGAEGSVLIVARSNPDGASGIGQDGGPVIGWQITPLR